MYLLFYPLFFYFVIWKKKVLLVVSGLFNLAVRVKPLLKGDNLSCNNLQFSHPILRFIERLCVSHSKHLLIIDDENLSVHISDQRGTYHRRGVCGSEIVHGQSEMVIAWRSTLGCLWSVDHDAVWTISSGVLLECEQQIILIFQLAIFFCFFLFFLFFFLLK
jgi:hypothetical protein